MLFVEGCKINGRYCASALPDIHMSIERGVEMTKKVSVSRTNS